MIKFTINGQPVEAQPEWTVLETARAYGIYIPTLCYHEAVSPTGACRLCVVEAKQGPASRVVASCMYPVSEGLEIQTDSDRVKNVRNWVLQMLLAECPSSPEIKAMAEANGVGGTRFEPGDPEQLCIMCGLCVRVCREVVGVEALSFGSRGLEKHVATPYMVPNEACIACGSCVAVCPTGAMSARLDRVRGDFSRRTGHGHAH
jgi:bidirectional [NiFe] hydrogenase diaphorase subunit